MKKVLLLFLTAIVSCIVGHAATIDLSFTAMGQTDWGTSYASHTYETNDFKIVFNSYNNQQSTITDVPVSKGSPLTISLKNNNTFKSIKFTLKQWGTKKQTATLQYSLDGTTFSAFSPAVSSSNFVVEATNIPDDVTAIKMTFSSTSNQVGVASIDYEINEDSPIEDNRTPVTLTWSPEEDVIELGTSYTAPTFSISNAEALASVEFSSNNPDLATVDANGLITLVDGVTGTAEITAAIPSTDEKYSAQKAVYTIIVNKPLDGSEFEDALTNANNCFGRIGQSGYGDASHTSKTTNISYSANLAGGNNSMQLRATTPSGIVVTANPNGLVAQKIIIEWNNNTDAARVLDIYGSNSPYTNTADLYSNGNSIASAPYGTTEVVLEDDYKYIGLRSNKNAMYIDKITIVWVKKVYTAEGAITVEEPYAYQYGNANVLSFAPTIKLNGNAIDDLTELAKFNVVLNGKVLGTAADAINHFAPKQGAENKFTVTKGDQTIEVANVVWPEIDVEPAIEQVEYVKADDGNVHAIYYVAPKTNNSNLHWTVATEHPNSLYWKEGHNGAACQFNNVATWTEGKEEFENLTHPSTFDASISFPFAVKKDSAAQGIRLMANDDEYGIEEYVAAPQSLADDIQNKEFQPNGDKSQTSGVADVAVDQEGEVEFFNLQGVRVNGELTPGLYIRRQGNRATKVVVK